nr:MAG TPA: hypothetical protein [Caudoviricetes sp.]
MGSESFPFIILDCSIHFYKDKRKFRRNYLC